MVLLRLLLVLTAISLALIFGLYVLTQDRRYLNLGRRVLRFVVFALLILGALYLLERYVLVGWGTLI